MKAKEAVAEQAAKAAEAKARVAAEKAASAEKALSDVKAKEATLATEAPSSSSTSGGRVLPKEEVSDDVKAFLKTLKK